MSAVQTQLSALLDEGAVFSVDRAYRYRLWRTWGDATKRCVFIGLNPSKADEHDDDMTLTKCMGFARRWGFGGVDMMNLFALVSTDPMGLARVADPVGGPAASEHLREVLQTATRIVFAWGSVRRELRETVDARVLEVRPMAQIYGRKAEWCCLGKTADGSPRHPSRIGYDTKLEWGLV